MKDSNSVLNLQSNHADITEHLGFFTESSWEQSSETTASTYLAMKDFNSKLNRAKSCWHNRASGILYRRFMGPVFYILWLVLKKGKNKNLSLHGSYHNTDIEIISFIMYSPFSSILPTQCSPVLVFLYGPNPDIKMDKSLWVCI